MSTYDPLSLLRDFTVNSKRIDITTNTHIFFGNIKVPLQHPTAWRKRTSDNSHYSVGSLWLFLKHQQGTFDMTAYLQDTRKYKVDSVIKIDQNEIKEYFTGVIDTTDAVDEDMRISTMIEKAKAEEEHKIQVREVMERPLCTKESILQSSVSFKQLLQTCKPYLESNEQRGTKRPRKHGPMSLIEEIMAMKMHVPEMQPHPIIIVPSLPLPGNIAIHTCKEFFTSGNYADPTVVKPAQNLQQPVLIEKRLRDLKGGRPLEVTFEVFDQVIGFTESHWDRLVAVFCQGSQYQFKEWSQEGGIKSIFLKHRGYFFKYQDTPLDESIKKLNVKVLEVQRNKRHFDKTTHNEFWKDMERFLFSTRQK